VLRNFLTLGAGEGIARAIQAAAFFVLARRVGAEALGQLGFAATIASYLSLVVLQGIDLGAIRIISRDARQLRPELEKILALRMSIAFLLVVVVAIYVSWRGVNTETLLLMILSFTAITAAANPRWAFVALENPRPIATAGVISQACFLAGVLLIRAPAQVIWAAGAQVMGEAAAAAYVLHRVRSICNGLRPWITLTNSVSLMHSALPVTLSLLIGNMLMNFDVFALGILRRPRPEIGIYIASYRILVMFSILITALQQSILPGIARIYPDAVEARHYVKATLWKFLPGAILAAVVISWFAPAILGILYGAQFREGGPLLTVLAWAIPLQLIRGVLRQLLVAFHLQRYDTVNAVTALAVNAGLDFLLIPEIGALGCAYSTLASEVVFFAMAYFRVRQSVARAA
jgi:O-antigen/teichoic acid export membrane protein